MARVDKDAVRRANPIERVIPALLGQCPIEVAAELRVRCPFHEDQTPSLRINAAKQQWCCDPCRAGGDIFTFVQRWLGVEFPEALAFLVARAGLGGAAAGHRPEREHIYDDEHGTPLYKVIIHGRALNGDKIVSQQRYDGYAGWVGGKGAMKGVRLVPYRLHQLQGKEAVIIVEGRKTSIALNSLDFPRHAIPAAQGSGTKAIRPRLEQRGDARRHRSGQRRSWTKPCGRDCWSCHAANLEVRIVGFPMCHRRATCQTSLSLSAIPN